MLSIVKDYFRIMGIHRGRIGAARCRLCGNTIFPGEERFFVFRWYKNKTIMPVSYCVNCISSKWEVLEEVDNDSIPYGIAKIDSYKHFKKKDYTRYIRRMNKQNLERKNE